MWKGFSFARSQIDVFHTQMDWSFLRLTLQHYFQLQCLPVHISYFLAKLHVFWGYQSREKGNFTRRTVKILPRIFPPESDDCNTSNRLYAGFFVYNQNLLTSQERKMAVTPKDPNTTPPEAGMIGEIHLKKLFKPEATTPFSKVLCICALLSPWRQNGLDHRVSQPLPRDRDRKVN